MNEEIDITNVTNREDIVIEENGVSLTITTTENQKNRENNNVTTINLGESEDKIKNIVKFQKINLYIFLK